MFAKIQTGSKIPNKLLFVFNPVAKRNQENLFEWFSFNLQVFTPQLKSGFVRKAGCDLLIFTGRYWVVIDITVPSMTRPCDPIYQMAVPAMALYSGRRIGWVLLSQQAVDLTPFVFHLLPLRKKGADVLRMGFILFGIRFYSWCVTPPLLSPAPTGLCPHEPTPSTPAHRLHTCRTTDSSWWSNNSFDFFAVFL